MSIAGKPLYADFLLDFVFAWVLGIGFQYFTIAPMRDITLAQSLWAAIKTDTSSVAAFQIGLFAEHAGLPGVALRARAGEDHGLVLVLTRLAMIMDFFITARPGERLAGPRRAGRGGCDRDRLSRPHRGGILLTSGHFA